MSESEQLMETKDMNYVDWFAAAIGGQLPPEMWPTNQEERLDMLRLYALVGMVNGRGTNSRDVHDAWSVWALKHRPGHKSLVPFEALSRDVQLLDDPYRDAIHRAGMGEMPLFCLHQPRHEGIGR